ncbi:Biotin-lipoyl like [Clostridium amylolyticum]|uniref:Biotin-lipoyl like n=1 Tax=Clostridium amylolyticum TaxID=1121298 RepID=A0A1M6BJ51_9CLOT|nr:efflux RND transporter periplasmic adaptor subunit [Clostridium amylolyticum]SHI48751.1 Biotin-lipoyl like [Clostridium amylolyticum]
MKKKLVILFSIVAVIIISGVFVLMPKKDKPQATKESNRIPLYTISQSDKVFVNGIILPEKVININQDPSKGTVSKVSVKTGQVVKGGDILFTYKNDQNEGKITNITAPIDGKVFLNDSNDQNKPFITIKSTALIVKSVINEKDLIKVKENQAADIFVYALDKTITGKVKSVASEPGSISDEDMQGMITGGSNLSVYGMRFSLDSQEGIVNGFHVQVSVKLSGEVKISKGSILEEDGKKYVFKVQDKKLIKQEIKYEEIKGSNDVSVNTGLKENDTIIITPTPDMKEGNVIE